MSSALLGVRVNLVDEEETDAAKIKCVRRRRGRAIAALMRACGRESFGEDMAVLVFDPKSRSLDKAGFVRTHIPEYVNRESARARARAASRGPTRRGRGGRLPVLERRVPALEADGAHGTVRRGR